MKNKIITFLVCTLLFATISSVALNSNNKIQTDIELVFTNLEQIELNSQLIQISENGLPCIDCEIEDFIEPKEKDDLRRENRAISISKLKFSSENDFVPLTSITIYVDDDNTGGPWDGTLANPYQYIQDGIDNANNGDTVYVFNGMYRENIMIDKSIQLLGESNSQTTIDANAAGNVVTGVVNNIHINNFTVKDGTESGIWFYQISDSSISNCVVQGNEYDGIYLDTCVNITVKNCDTLNNWYEGIDLWPAINCSIIDCFSRMDGDGLCIYSDYGIAASGNYIENCDFENSWAEGFWIHNTTENVFSNCSTKNIDYDGGWIQMDSNDNTFINCDFDSSTEYGIYIGWQSNGNTFIDCSIHDTNNELEKGYGIYSSDSVGNNFIGCEVYDNILGVYLKQSPGCSFIGNNIHDNDFNFNFEPNYGAQDLYMSTVDTTNLIEGKPMYWYTGVSDMEINESHNAGYVAFFDSTNITVKNIVASGILMVNTTYSFIENVVVHNCKHGILLLDSTNIDILDSSGYLNMNGVMAMESPYIDIIDCTFHDNPSHNCYDGRGICLMYSSIGCNIINCTTYNNSWIGIGADWESHYTTIKNCVSYNNYGACHPGGPWFGYGIVLYYYVSGSVVENCTTWDNYNSGLTVFHGSNNIVKNCTSYNSLENGIYIYSGSENNEVYNCITYDNTIAGVNIFKSSNNIVRNCEVYGSTYGVYIEDTSYSNNIYHNNITNNTNNAYDSCTNNWDDDYPSGGNYWSDYTGRDIDGDGIGDIPYDIPGGNNQDRYPLCYIAGTNDAPSAPLISGNVNGTPGEVIEYGFVSTDPDDDDVFYFIDWGDNTFEEWIGPYNSGEEIMVNHSWSEYGVYEISAKAKDLYDAESNWTIFEVIIGGNNAPDAPIISGETNGKAGEEYEYTFVSTDSESDDVYYFIDWDDDTTEEWIGPYLSGEEVIVNHTWDEEGTYIIQAKAKDIYDAESDWGSLEVTMPFLHQYIVVTFLKMVFERFPNAFPILRYILGL